MKTPSDDLFMELALAEARKAWAAGEVPVGAVLTRDGEILARGFNSPIARRDPTAHAEIAAIREAALAVDNYRLPGTTLYVTLEPCAMCAGAILQARIRRVVYGTEDPKGGSVTSLYRLLQDERFNHAVSVTGGVLRQPCQEILSGFFREKRISSAPLLTGEIPKWS